MHREQVASVVIVLSFLTLLQYLPFWDTTIERRSWELFPIIDFFVDSELHEDAVEEDPIYVCSPSICTNTAVAIAVAILASPAPLHASCIST
jgi:hypothetical protein